MARYKAPADVTRQTAEFLAKLAVLKLPPVVDLTPAEAREQMERGVAARPITSPALKEVRELRIPGPAGLIAARLYIPVTASTEPMGLLVYYHGGGHVIGSLFSHDGIARNLAANGRCAVLSVDYRMGPEHIFPAAVDDSWTALEWASVNADALGIAADRIAVGGDSAGGNLAAVMALMARDRNAVGDHKVQVCFQLLIYPLVDYRCEGASYEEFAKGYGILEKDTMLWFQRHYLGKSEAHRTDWRASPLLARSHADLPPALILAAGCDVLRSEVRGYASTLIAAGVSVEYREYAGVLHGFFGLVEMIDEADAATHDAGRALITAMTE